MQIHVTNGQSNLAKAASTIVLGHRESLPANRTSIRSAVFEPRRRDRLTD